MRIIRCGRSMPALTVAFALLSACADAFAQDPCGEWASGLFPYPGTSGSDVHALAVFDDGDGPALYLGGNFSTAGDAPAQSMARWDGRSFKPVGAGVTGPNSTTDVLDLEVADLGAGPRLYAGGDFTMNGDASARRLAEWNGRSWTALGNGLNAVVHSLAAFDDGTGPALYAGGGFTIAGDGSALRVARWNGTSWSAVGSGFSTGVYALRVFDDGTGTALFAAGGSGPSGFVSRWNGVAWTPVGASLDGRVNDLAIFDDGSGAALYVGGDFRFADGVRVDGIARWNGSTFDPLGTHDFGAMSLFVFDDGSGARLYAGTTNVLSRWDGSSWETLSRSGARFGRDSFRELAVFDAGDGAALYVAGHFERVGGTPASNVARWDGTRFTSLGPGLNNFVHSLTVLDDGSGPALYAGGLFTRIGDTQANRVARWNGTAFTPLGEGVDAAFEALVGFDDGNGLALHLGGSFAGGVSKWNGTAFSPLGSGVNGTVNDLVAITSGSRHSLFAGGVFSTAGGAPAARIAKWDGNAWSPLGSGMNGVVNALAAFDDGTGVALYAGGDFTEAGGAPASRVARWDGRQFTPLGGGLNGRVECLAVYDDGTGASLYAGGSFTTADDAPAERVARWDGQRWSPLGRGINGRVRDLAVFDDGSGASLYTGGEFSEAGRATTHNVARWNGSGWSSLGTGTDAVSSGGVLTLAAFDDGSEAALFAGGAFSRAGGAVSRFMAKWSVAPPSACPWGNVDASAGRSPADVLFVNDSAEDPSCRRVEVSRSAPSRITVLRPPAGGPGQFALWIHDGAPRPSDARPVRLRDGSGTVHELGLGCRCLPSENLVSRAACPCPGTFPLGRASMPLGSRLARRVCVNREALAERAPTSFLQTFPPGTFTVCGLIVDPGSPNSMPISIMNWVVVESR